MPKLWALNIELLARLGQNSRKSLRPPSSDGPSSGGAGAGGDGEPDPQRRKRGAQPGHKGQRRALVEHVDTIVEHAPTGTCACGGAWERAEAPYRRHQVFELPEPRMKSPSIGCTGGVVFAAGQHCLPSDRRICPTGRWGRGCWPGSRC